MESKMRIFCALLAVCALSVEALPRTSQRIVGGSLATISQYPYAVAMLYGTSSYFQSCGGTILTSTAVLSAAQCVVGNTPSRWRVRVGSSFSSSGGSVHTIRLLTYHAGYNAQTMDNDVAVLRTSTPITFIPNAVAPATIAGPNYVLNDNQAVFAVGWGTTSSGGGTSEQLRQVQVWTVNQATCRGRYSELGYGVTDNMLCSGWLDVGGRDQCQGDSGGPLIHNNVIVGVCSWGYRCAQPRYPGVNTRVSKYTSWIQNAVA
ncbi:trypsin, alkaline C [Plutella xylostella]|uniref:trypsin, alkaline C n=1 Tax=Plutella xylostella TaxID=51655 RepID=UPI0020323C40|nr:trypsin, alkaline C [Plutella xylostella]